MGREHVKRGDDNAQESTGCEPTGPAHRRQHPDCLSRSLDWVKRTGCFRFNQSFVNVVMITLRNGNAIVLQVADASTDERLTGELVRSGHEQLPIAVGQDAQSIEHGGHPGQ